MTKVVILSDTHNLHNQLKIPDGDIIIHAGDSTQNGTIEELNSFANWFRSLPFKTKISIAGNHDEILQSNTSMLDGIEYLLDRLIVVDGLRIYGSPYKIVPDVWMKEKKRWNAFKVNETWATHIWKDIPLNLDILITHIPPRGILDEVDGIHYGSMALLEAVKRIKPRYHIFGHQHDCGGSIIKIEETIFINVAMCYPRTTDYKMNGIREKVRVIEL